MNYKSSDEDTLRSALLQNSNFPVSHLLFTNIYLFCVWVIFITPFDNKTNMERYKEIIQQLIQFRNERDWEQFHDSKNLALALSIEAAELNELFLWKKGEEVEKVDPDKLREELADVLAYAFLLAEKHKLNIFDILQEKIKKNNAKYPVHKAKGTAKKYNEL
ncbi:MAG TPA: nucleotide pyrophosphohydrolase [Mariniphaga sp.]|nr:nucleotide pyrophosphohydrolase [Mariniphaga sp.]